MGMALAKGMGRPLRAIDHLNLFPMPISPREYTTRFLSDLYSVERQALVQMESAPSLAGDPTLAAPYERHREETAGHAHRVRARLEALGEKPSGLKDAIMRIGGQGFILFARMQTKSPGRLLAHCLAYEAMEWAGYEVLVQIAQRAQDGQTESLARAIQAEERTMMDRLEDCFDLAEHVANAELDPEDYPDAVCSHLAEAHALATQTRQLLERGIKLAGKPSLGQLYQRHLAEMEAQLRLLEQRLEVLGGNTSMLEDAALRLGGLGWSAFFAAQPDTPDKFAGFVYAVKFLEIGGLELLVRTVGHANDAETVALCRRFIAEDRAAAARIASHLGDAVEATLAHG